MRATLPIPPSVNHYWLPTARHGKRLSPAALTFRRKVAHALHGIEPLRGPVFVEWWAYRPQKWGDVDNFNKALLDALTGFVYADDSQVEDLLCHNRVDTKRPRLELEWRSLEPQGALFTTVAPPAQVVYVGGIPVSVRSDRLRPAVIRPGGSTR